MLHEYYSELLTSIASDLAIVSIMYYAFYLFFKYMYI